MRRFLRPSTLWLLALALPIQGEAAAPVAARWTPLPRDATDAGAPQFLAGGTERPPGLLA